MDRRSLEALEYRKLYKRKRWLDIRAIQLGRQPLCEWCLERGEVVAATECHHDNPKQKFDPSTFHDGPFTSLCKACHDGRAQSIEVRGYSKEIGPDGWPIDPSHPANRGGGGEKSPTAQTLDRRPHRTQN